MTLREFYDMPWIGHEHPVLDLTNTVVIGAGPGHGDVDFLSDPGLTAAWRERLGNRALAREPLGALRALRAPLRAAVDARARGEQIPDRTREELNTLAAGAPVTMRLGADGGLVHEEAADDVGAVLAREALVLLAREGKERLRRCDAPSCGMYFLRTRRDQAWCTVMCGNRARAARRRPAS
ncbi:ABATE domain-containing protein [Nocardiopsis lucentensis]|uniref:ABATE domain-containing protein n=1 Tax=Nocardiopsis lucentensis TaxID=53441 RepID=UPI00034B72CF|nr:ABATE domain-containing protein [Nocardiopsis lucentensis]